MWISPVAGRDIFKRFNIRLVTLKSLPRIAEEEPILLIKRTGLTSLSGISVIAQAKPELK